METMFATAGTVDATLARLNYFNEEDFFQPKAAAGELRDAYGRRIVRASADFLSALTFALEKELGEAAGDVLYKLGSSWGAEEMKACAARTPQEFGVDAVEQMNLNVLLESWRWPLSTSGWGMWRYDFRFAKQGLPQVELQNSAAVAASGRTGKHVCHLYAGQFAACFSHLAGRELVGVETQCASVGADFCRFVVTTAPRAATALKLREEGVSADEILSRLGGSPAAAATTKVNSR